MRVLITGSGGFIGQYLTKFFLERGEHVTAAYRHRKPEQGSHFLNHLQPVFCDLSEDCSGLGSADIVIHAAAAQPASEKSFQTDDYLRSNVLATWNLTRHFKERPPKAFIFLSTVSVYGEIESSEIDETTPLVNPEIYGLTKRLGELILQDLSRSYGVLCVRLPGVLGEGYFAPRLGQTVQKICRNEPVSIYNPDSLFNNVVDLLEIGNFLSHVIRKEVKGFDIVNLAADEPMKLEDVVEFVRSLTNSRSIVTKQSAPKESYSINVNKIKQAYKFEPSCTREIIRRYVEQNMEGLLREN